MKDDMDDLRRRMDLSERNQSDLARTVTELVHSLRETADDVIEIQRNEAVNAEREKSRDEWRKRTEAKLDGIYRLGWWVLATFGSLTMAAIANLLYSGGGVGPG